MELKLCPEAVSWEGKTYDLLVGRAHLGWVVDTVTNLASELLLDGVEAWSGISVTRNDMEEYRRCDKLTLVGVIFLTSGSRHVV